MISAFTYLYNIIHWRYFEEKMTGKKMIWMGRAVLVTKETYHFFWLKGYPVPFRKEDFKTVNLIVDGGKKKNIN